MEIFADTDNLIFAEIREDINQKCKLRQRMREVDLIVLDNSMRESTVGQLRGHTLENKWKIYDEVSHKIF